MSFVCLRCVKGFLPTTLPHPLTCIRRPHNLMSLSQLQRRSRWVYVCMSCPHACHACNNIICPCFVGVYVLVGGCGCGCFALCVCGICVRVPHLYAHACAHTHKHTHTHHTYTRARCPLAQFNRSAPEFTPKALGSPLVQGGCVYVCTTGLLGGCMRVCELFVRPIALHSQQEASASRSGYPTRVTTCARAHAHTHTRTLSLSLSLRRVRWLPLLS